MQLLHESGKYLLSPSVLVKNTRAIKRAKIPAITTIIIAYTGKRLAFELVNNNGGGAGGSGGDGGGAGGIEGTGGGEGGGAGGGEGGKGGGGVMWYTLKLPIELWLLYTPTIASSEETAMLHPKSR